MTQIFPRISTHKGDASEVSGEGQDFINTKTAILSKRPQFFFEINES